MALLNALWTISAFLVFVSWNVGSWRDRNGVAFQCLLVDLDGSVYLDETKRDLSSIPDDVKV